MSASDGEAAALARLAAARTRLLLERPFVGALILYLPLVPDARCRTIATDGRRLYFSAAHVLSLTFAETQFMLAHQALHCALGHFARRGHRLRAKWDFACDYAVNGLLIDDGMKAPAQAPWDPAFRGLSAEEIYPLLGDAPEGERQDEHRFGANLPAPRDGFEADRAEPDAEFLEAHRDGFDEVGFRLPAPAVESELVETWRSRLASNATEAARAGRLSGHWSAIAGEAMAPRLPWRSLLERFMMRVARDDFSFARRSRREGDALLPGMESGEANLVVAVDTSGSIPRDALEEFIEEIDGMKGQIRANVALVLCDAALAPGMPLRFQPWERIAMPEAAQGGGGTRFTPVFEWVEGGIARPDALLYFTDAEGEFPGRAPDYPVMWIVLGSAPVPFGERVQLN